MKLKAYSSILCRYGLLFSVMVKPSFAYVTQDGPVSGRPEAIVDLRTHQGAALLKTQWRYSDVKVIKSHFHEPGPDLKPTGPVNDTYEISPQAGALEFDDSKWEMLEPEKLETRKGHGRTSFVWYRLNITIPEKVGKIGTKGKTAIFEIVIDDYAEIWVNGKLPEILGQTGGQVAKGWNSPNRVILTKDAKPGDVFQIAVLGTNGPISKSPKNYIWVRSATVDFFTPEAAKTAVPVETKIDVRDPDLYDLLDPGTKMERVASGFFFTEGPVWVRNGGYLLFSDPNNNTIYRYNPDGQVSVYRTKSGYTGTDVGEFEQPGSNGLTLDPQGRLTIDEQGNRRVTLLEKNGTLVVLADKYEGKRLNSPNDLVYKSDGSLYFTDPPYGLPKFFHDARKELPFSGVFLVRKGELKLVSKDLAGPNGLAFSPDEKYLYVDNWDEKIGKDRVILRYEVQEDGTLKNGIEFFNMNGASGKDNLDGMKVDVKGNLYVSGPGGIWIIASSGKLLGIVEGPEHGHNYAWGDDDGKTLYIAGHTSIYRMHMKVEGIRP